jgi:hypothetical protein
MPETHLHLEVAIHDFPSEHFVRDDVELNREQFDELVLHVLDEVEASTALLDVQNAHVDLRDYFGGEIIFVDMENGERDARTNWKW